MILLGLVSMLIFLGMPYLVDNSKSIPQNERSFDRPDTAEPPV
jgi:hypothetical protein